MIQSLLFLARADESGMALRPDGVDAGGAIREVMDFSPALAEEKGVSLSGGGGSGLGLAIVKTILRLHGGEVVLKNNPPSGVVFRLHFPGTV